MRMAFLGGGQWLKGGVPMDQHFQGVTGLQGCDALVYSITELPYCARWRHKDNIQYGALSTLLTELLTQSADTDVIEPVQT